LLTIIRETKQEIKEKQHAAKDNQQQQQLELFKKQLGEVVASGLSLYEQGREL
jgi:hypothetical protein